MEQEDVALAEGTRLGQYAIVRLIAAGSMGMVYEAEHRGIGKRVALKVLSPRLAGTTAARLRFLHEASVTARLNHPHIVDVTDRGDDGGHAYLVMELLRGEDLAQRLQRTGPIAAEEMVDLMLPVCAAIASAHKGGVTHRDLKPSNIFLAEREGRVHPTVLDFGISTGTQAIEALDARTLSRAGAVVGTPYYLAPEQVLDSRSASPASDQYALGVILYECLTGQRPFDGRDISAVFRTIRGGNARRPSALRPELPAALEDVALRAMKQSPRSRFESVKEFGRALLPFASGRARLLWEETFSGATPAPSPVAAASSSSAPSEASGKTPVPRKTSSPAIAAEAATPSPYVRTLTPEVQAIEQPVDLPLEESAELGPPLDGRAPDAPPEEDVPLEFPGLAWSRARRTRVIGGVAVAGIVTISIVVLVAGRAGSRPERPTSAAAPAAAPAPVAVVEPPTPPAPPPAAPAEPPPAAARAEAEIAPAPPPPKSEPANAEAPKTEPANMVTPRMPTVEAEAEAARPKTEAVVAPGKAERETDSAGTTPATTAHKRVRPAATEGGAVSRKSRVPILD